jgi:hypothetical protein
MRVGAPRARPSLERRLDVEKVAEKGAEGWALDPWTTDEIRFLPVPPEVGAMYLVTKPRAPVDALRFLAREPFAARPEAEPTTRRGYTSETLGWRGWVYVAAKDTDRLLAALQAVERLLLLVRLAAGGAT